MGITQMFEEFILDTTENYDLQIIQTQLASKKHLQYLLFK